MRQSLRLVLSGAGFLCIGLGILGLFLPLLPTTPFLLLAAACFARSSERFHQQLINHRTFGPLILHYQRDRSIPARARWSAVVLLWVMLASSLLWVPLFWVQLLLVGIGLAVTFYLFQLKTAV